LVWFDGSQIWWLLSTKLLQQSFYPEGVQSGCCASNWRLMIGWNPFRCWSWLYGKAKLTVARLRTRLIINGTKQVAPSVLDWTSRIQLVLIGKAAESTAVLMLSYRMCCLFWTKFVERTTLRRSLLSDLAIHKCLALVNIDRVLPVDDVTIGL
jgi:hypothetical protein